LAKVGGVTELGDHVGAYVFGEMIGRVAPRPVDAFGVVVEAATGVHEDEDRRLAAVGLA
jgi:hypothetical protein